MEKLRIYNVKWTSHSAGPSTDGNKRTEIFLAGCKRAEEGNPCKGCFNPSLWKSDSYFGLSSPEEALRNIKKNAHNRYITFVGGEPLDQLNPLSELCRLLKEAGYHIIVITHYTLSEQKDMMNEDNKDSWCKLWNNIDIMIDGEYREEERIWDSEKAGDGLHDVIGSGNQVIWDFKGWRDTDFKDMYGCPAGNLEGLYMNNNDDFVYILKNEPEYIQSEG